MKNILLSLVLPLLLASACGRLLTKSEMNFAATILGDQVQTSRVRIAEIGLVNQFTSKRSKRPRLACRERIWPEPTSETVTVGTAAFVLNDTIYVSTPYYSRDFVAGYPERLDLANAMLFAHEMTHVWQWQNRKTTHYSPWKAASEHGRGTDPYLLNLSAAPKFLDFPFEQQASIVEEYVCCRSLDPGGARTKRLENMLNGVFALDDLNANLPQSKILVPWKGVHIRGICG